ncbi:MAG: OmpH family outer membrane protein [Synergistaceae bacterium]|nr:OmpH family outer membrane protein [Synergistaceae bacterium]
MKKAVFILAAIFAVFGAGAAFAADGLVNADAVLANYPKFVQARQQLATLAQQKETAIRAEKDKTKQQQLAQEAQQQLVQEEQKLMSPILSDVRAAIAKVAKAKKLGMVHAAATVMYGGTDITQDVIAELKK